MSLKSNYAATTYLGGFLRVAIVGFGLLVWTGIGALLAVAVIVLAA